jgi:hypothetical protein
MELYGATLRQPFEVKRLFRLYLYDIEHSLAFREPNHIRIYNLQTCMHVSTFYALSVRLGTRLNTWYVRIYITWVCSHQGCRTTRRYQRIQTCAECNEARVLERPQGKWSKWYYLIYSTQRNWFCIAHHTQLQKRPPDYFQPSNMTW